MPGACTQYGGEQQQRRKADPASGREGSGVGSSDDGSASPHMGLVSLVLVAVLGLLLLDKAGFKFAVSVGKR